MFIHYKPKFHKVKGHQIRKLLSYLNKGDILLRRFDGYLSTFAIKGFWSHAGIYIGDDRVIHALGQGVTEEDILDFCRTDHLAVMRLSRDYVHYRSPSAVVSTAIEMKGVPYDYDFNFKDRSSTSCTELVNLCYGEVFSSDMIKYNGEPVLFPDGLYNSSKLLLVTEFRN
jgi:uncharacterized protein YycO